MNAAKTTPPLAVPTEADALAGVHDLLSINDLSTAELTGLLNVAARVKARPHAFAGSLAGLSTVLLFEKPSLRTRMSFEIGITRLGGHAVYFDHAAQRIGQREAVKDYARNLERWCDAVVARVYSHAVLEQLAEHASIPVINALSDREHPCQALADVLTLTERFGSVAGLRIAWVGDGNNVCHSLLLAAARLGASLTVITPPGREPCPRVVASAAAHGAGVVVTNDPRAVDAHHAVYTDAWVSMGAAPIAADAADHPFAGFTVDAAMMERASRGIAGGAVFMHCLPAHRGEEVSDEVIDAPASLVYDQAENRMHAQNALMLAALARLPGRQ